MSCGLFTVQLNRPQDTFRVKHSRGSYSDTLYMEDSKFCLGYDYLNRRLLLSNMEISSIYLENVKGSRYAGRTLKKTKSGSIPILLINDNDERILWFHYSRNRKQSSYEVIEKTRGSHFVDFMPISRERVFTLTEDGVIALWSVGNQEISPPYLCQDIKIKPAFRKYVQVESFKAASFMPETNYLVVSSHI